MSTTHFIDVVGHVMVNLYDLRRIFPEISRMRLIQVVEGMRSITQHPEFFCMVQFVFLNFFLQRLGCFLGSELFVNLCEAEEESDESRSVAIMIPHI